MSSNNDNSMTRFLFAILRQKNLKDIDWHKVAHDPILTAEITNGHAARMRYSRFRSAMLGLEPTRRNRTGPPKSRVTKSKKDPKSSRKYDRLKSESAAGSPTPAADTIVAAASPEPIPQQQQQQQQALPRQKIKQENPQQPQYVYNNRMTPALTPGPVSMPHPQPLSLAQNMGNNPTMNTSMLHNRFPTPCSDTDTFTPSPCMTGSPASDMMQQYPQGPYEYQPTAYQDHMDGTYFALAYPYPDYTPAAPSDHQHHHSALLAQGLPVAYPSQSIESDIGHVDVKREEWNRCE